MPPHSRTLHSRRARMEGFLVNDFADRDAEAMAALTEWVAAGQLTYRENIVAGIENAPAAFSWGSSPGPTSASNWCA